MPMFLRYRLVDVNRGKEFLVGNVKNLNGDQNVQETI